MRLIIGILSTTLVAGNVVVHCIPLFLMGFVRVALRLVGLRTAENRLAQAMDGIIDSWVGFNRWLFRVLGVSRVNVRWQDDGDLSRKRWYMVISNHQSWTDILILQTMLFGRIPPLKFFTKRQLLWIPFLGLAMWLLDFPYVRRISREKIAADPALLEIDRNATREACQKFRNHPTSALNFLEGTRFTPEKYAAQDAPRFEHLLNPKSGGLSQVLSALDDRLHRLIDVTLDYPQGVPTFWEFMQGRCPEITMDVVCRTVPDSIRHAADEDTRRRATAGWVEALWTQKDQTLSTHTRTGRAAV
ncbi:MAG: acetyltransferase [Pseudomonadales bacterium]